MSNIRSYIDNHLKDNGYKLQQFSEIVDINVGTLSAIIRKSQTYFNEPTRPDYLCNGFGTGVLL